MPEDRLIAGIRCRQVLAELSEYMDGNLADDRVQQIQTHVKACDWCERFGGRFSAVIAALRQELSTADPVPEPVRERLRERLRKEIGEA